MVLTDPTQSRGNPVSGMERLEEVLATKHENASVAPISHSLETRRQPLFSSQ